MIGITFNPKATGARVNDIRSQLLKLISSPTLQNARPLAESLQDQTTGRSKLGLLFIVLGSEGSKRRLYLSRFPADVGIVAQEDDEELKVELLEQVFLKNVTTYKAVLYEGTNVNLTSSHFWEGKAIDKQISDRLVAISSYWIHGFLDSDFKTTPVQGSQRLAVAIKNTIEDTDDIEIKDELVTASIVARRMNGQVFSMNNFAERLALSDKTRDALFKKINNPKCKFDEFVFDSSVFNKLVKFRSAILSNGAKLTAPSERFDDVFTREQTSLDSSEVIFKTQGTVVDEKLTG